MAKFLRFDAKGTDGSKTVWAIFDDGSETAVATKDMDTWLKNQLALESTAKSETQVLNETVQDILSRLKAVEEKLGIATKT